MLFKLYKNKNIIVFIMFFIWFFIVDINFMTKGRSFFFKYDFPHGLIIAPHISSRDHFIIENWDEGFMAGAQRADFTSYDKKLENIRLEGFKYNNNYVLLIGDDEKFGKYYSVTGLFDYSKTTKKYYLGTKVFSEEKFKISKYYTDFKNLKLYYIGCNCGTFVYTLFYSILARALSIIIIFTYIVLFTRSFYKYLKNKKLSM